MKKNQKAIDALFNAMTPIPGEVRTVNRCERCKTLFGRRFIPFGMGRGLTINMCTCVAVSINTKWTELEKRTP